MYFVKVNVERNPMIEYIMIESIMKVVCFSMPSIARNPMNIEVANPVYIISENGFFVKMQPKIVIEKRKYKMYNGISFYMILFVILYILISKIRIRENFAV
jgi:hypothetical protein